MGLVMWCRAACGAGGWCGALEAGEEPSPAGPEAELSPSPTCPLFQSSFRRPPRWILPILGLLRGAALSSFSRPLRSGPRCPICTDETVSTGAACHTPSMAGARAGAACRSDLGTQVTQVKGPSSLSVTSPLPSPPPMKVQSCPEPEVINRCTGCPFWV